jgi:hypothetical protein
MIKRILCQILLTASVSFAWAHEAFGLDLGLGLAAIDEMDDRLKPAAVVRAVWTPEFFTDFTFYGQDFAPVSTRTAIITAGAQIKVGKSEHFLLRAGVSLMDEYISTYDDAKSRGDPHAPKPKSENDYNAGFLLGLECKVFTSGPVYLAFDWDAHLFGAGLEGTLFFDFGRKEIFSAVAGVSL